jgi:branched-subunit amino acid transport protein
MSWTLIIILSLVTFAARLSFIAFSSMHNMPNWLKQSLQYVPAAAFATIVAPQLLLHNGVVITTLLDPRVIAAVVTALVTIWVSNLTVAMAAGMGTLWLLQWLLG